jgi:branched-chain amino acid transport system permease protein
LYAIAAVGVTLIGGGAGQITLGLAGPIALGAYTSALLVTSAGWSSLASLLAAGVVAAVVSTLLTLPVWRLGGHTVAIATLGVGVVTVALIRNAEPLTRGAYGLTGIPPIELFGLSLTTPLDNYWFGLVLLGITVLVIGTITRSRLGTVIAAVGADETAARSAGVRARNYKALAFALCAFFAGIAGALLAQQYSYIDPTVFNQSMSVLVLTIAVLGGLRSPAGAVLGAIILVGVPELLRVAPEVRIIGYGVILLLAVRFRPQGLWMRRAETSTSTITTLDTDTSDQLSEKAVAK